MRQPISRIRSWRLSVLVGLGLLALLASGAVVPAGARPANAWAAPAIQITPNHGRCGTVTVVTGQGFAPHEQLAIYRQTRPSFVHETDSTGSCLGVPSAVRTGDPCPG